MAKKQKRTSARKPAKPLALPTIDHKPEEDDDGYGDDGLKLRWRAFVAAYTGPAGGNASKAAEMAGYAAENRIALGVTASRLLRNAKIAQAIALSFAAKNVTPEWCQKRLCDLALADMNNFVTVDDDGVAQLDMKKAEALGAIGQVKEYDAVRAKLKLHDPTPALTSLMKMFGLLKDTHIHTGPNGGPISMTFDDTGFTDEELLRIRRAFASRGAGPAAQEQGRN